jgi:hypothetical protein
VTQIEKLLTERGPMDVEQLAIELAKIAPRSEHAKDYLAGRNFWPSERWSCHWWVDNLYAHLGEHLRVGKIEREKIGKRFVYNII